MIFNNSTRVSNKPSKSITFPNLKLHVRIGRPRKVRLSYTREIAYRAAKNPVKLARRRDGGGERSSEGTKKGGRRMEPIRLVCRSSEEVGSFKVRSHILPMAGSGHARRRRVVFVAREISWKRYRRVKEESKLDKRLRGSEEEEKGERWYASDPERREGERERDEWKPFIIEFVFIYYGTSFNRTQLPSYRRCCTGDKPTFSAE